MFKGETGVYILLGSNEGDRRQHLRRARALIEAQAGRIAISSSIYQTDAWGKTDQPAFFNQVLMMETNLDPHALLETLQTIEKQLGRIRTTRWAQRSIDIDILFYNTLIVQSDKLTIPHPGIPSRRFTLVPLAEIAGSLIHPVLGKTITDLLIACQDPLRVERLDA